MSPATSPFSTGAQPEVFFTSTAVSKQVRTDLRAGRIRQLGPRLYTANLDAPAEELCRRNWVAIAAGYFPGAVIVGRTALDWRPAADGSVFLAPRRRDVELPGLHLRAATGSGPQRGDERLFGHDVHMSSRARAFLENLRPSRTTGGLVSRTAGRRAVEEELDRYSTADPSALNNLRDEARALADPLDCQAEFKVLDSIVGTLLGARQAALVSPVAAATVAGRPYDTHRVERLQRFASTLLSRASPRCAANNHHDQSAFAFFEAYFSNYIEGTEFTVREAQDIIFGGAMPAQRPRDAHDILGTYQLIIDRHQRERVPSSADELIDIIKYQHETMLAARPDIGPGQFKQRANHVGGREFVLPRLVEGTLREGYRFYDSLPAGFARAVFAMFLVSEVHPFADGNGRTGRLLMNSELTAAEQQRIIVTTRARDDYLTGLRGMTNHLNIDAYLSIMTALQQQTAQTDYSDLHAAETDLEARQAFTDPDDLTPSGLIAPLNATDSSS